MKDGRKRPDLKIASDAKQDRADDLLGAVVPSRGSDNPAASLPPEADLSNVVAFARRNKKAAKPARRRLKSRSQDRPAPFSLSPERQRQIALLIGASILVHGALFAVLQSRTGAACEHRDDLGDCRNRSWCANQCRQIANAERIRSRKPLSPTTDEPNDTQTEKARKDIAKKPVEEPKEEAKQEKAETASPKAEEAPPVEKLPVPKEQAELVVQTKAGRKTDADDRRKEARSERHQESPRGSAPRQGRWRKQTRPCGASFVPFARHPTASDADDPISIPIIAASSRRIWRATSRFPVRRPQPRRLTAQRPYRSA